MAEATYGSNIVSNPSAATNITGWTAVDTERSTIAISSTLTSFKLSPNGSLMQSLILQGMQNTIKVSFNARLLDPVPFYETSIPLQATLTGVFVHTETTTVDGVETSTSTTENRIYNVPVVFHKYTFTGVAEFTFPDALVTNVKLTLKAGNVTVYANEINVFLKSTVPSLSEQIDETKKYSVEKTGELFAKIADTDGNVLEITQSVSSLSSRIADAEGNVSTLTQTSTNFTAAFELVGVDGYEHTGKTVIDAGGLTVYDGGLKVYSSTDELVFNAASSGTVYAKGSFETTGSWGKTVVAGGAVNFYDASSSAVGRLYYSDYYRYVQLETNMSDIVLNAGSPYQVKIAIGNELCYAFGGSGAAFYKPIDINGGFKVNGDAGFDCTTDVREANNWVRRLEFKSGILINSEIITQ